MSNKKEIKTVCVNGQDLKYIEKESLGGLSYYTTTFMAFDIPDNYGDAFATTGGYTRDVLYGALKDIDVNRMAIISNVKKGKGHRIYFIFEKDGEVINYVASAEEIFLGHVVDFLAENESILGKIKIENSLNYIEDEKYGAFMEDYDEPLSVNQSGLKLGNDNILFGEKFTVKGLTKIKGMFLGKLLELVDEEGIDTLRVNVSDSIGIYDMVSDSYLLKEDGEPYTVLDDLQREMYKGKGLTDEEVFEAELQSDLERLQKDIDRHMKRLAGKDFTEEELNEHLENYKRRIDFDRQVIKTREDLKKELQEPYPQLIPRHAINAIINNSNTTVERDK